MATANAADPYVRGSTSGAEEASGCKNLRTQVLVEVEVQLLST